MTVIKLLTSCPSLQLTGTAAFGVFPFPMPSPVPEHIRHPTLEIRNLYHNMSVMLLNLFCYSRAVPKLILKLSYHYYCALSMIFCLSCIRHLLFKLHLPGRALFQEYLFIQRFLFFRQLKYRFCINFLKRLSAYRLCF